MNAGLVKLAAIGVAAVILLAVWVINSIRRGEFYAPFDSDTLKSLCYGLSLLPLMLLPFLLIFLAFRFCGTFFEIFFTIIIVGLFILECVGIYKKSKIAYIVLALINMLVIVGILIAFLSFSESGLRMLLFGFMLYFGFILWGLIGYIRDLGD